MWSLFRVTVFIYFFLLEIFYFFFFSDIFFVINRYLLQKELLHNSKISRYFFHVSKHENSLTTLFLNEKTLFNLEKIDINPKYKLKSIFWTSKIKLFPKVLDESFLYIETIYVKEHKFESMDDDHPRETEPIDEYYQFTLSNFFKKCTNVKNIYN